MHSHCEFFANKLTRDHSPGRVALEIKLHLKRISKRLIQKVSLKNSRFGGQLLAYYSNDSSSYPAEAYSFFCTICVRKKQNRDQGWPI